MYQDYWSLWGIPEMRDPRINQISEWEIKKMIVRKEATIEDVGNAHGILRLRDGRWTMLNGGWKSNRWPTEDEAYGRPDSTYHKNYLPWNSGEWKEKFEYCRDKHQIRKETFAATIQAVKAGEYVTEQGHVVQIPKDEQLISGSKVYVNEKYFSIPKEVFETEISVENEDCLVVAERMVRRGGKNVAVLNMANRQTPGGGVYTGAGAQEESCFRRSNYYLSLYQYTDFAYQYGIRKNPEAQYPLDRNFGGCFSPNVTVFRGPEKEGYPFLEEPWKVNFIAVPALNRPELMETPFGEKRIAKHLVPAALNKIRTIFNIAIDNGIDVLVLGAHGCGAFKNPPRHMAELFSWVLEEPVYKGRFRKIIFAIIGSEENYSAFDTVFSMNLPERNFPKSEVVSISIKEGTKAIHRDAFKGYTKLRNVQLSDSIVKIEENAFQNLSELKEITFHENLQQIGRKAFSKCNNLGKIEFPKTMKMVGGCAFEECTGLKEAVFKGEDTKIEYSAFNGCKSLERVILPKNLKRLEFSTFSKCESLKEIDLPKNLTRIEDWAFSDCSSLEQIGFPETLEYVGKSVFSGCEKLELSDREEWHCV